jgi:hypothetical protein
MKKIITRVIFVFILIVALFFFWKYAFTYSDGYRAGLLQKFSRKGMFFKTYEGEMILSSVRSTTDMAIASEKFFFSVTDKNLAQKFNNLQGEFIVVHYHEKNGALPWRGESKYIVDSVRIKEDRIPRRD